MAIASTVLLLFSQEMIGARNNSCRVKPIWRLLRPIIQIGDTHLQCFDEFRYLGHVVTLDYEVTMEIKAIIATGNSCLFGMQEALKFSARSKWEKYG